MAPWSLKSAHRCVRVGVPVLPRCPQTRPKTDILKATRRFCTQASVSTTIPQEEAGPLGQMADFWAGTEGPESLVPESREAMTHHMTAPRATPAQREARQRSTDAC